MEQDLYQKAIKTVNDIGIGNNNAEAITQKYIQAIENGKVLVALMLHRKMLRLRDKSQGQSTLKSAREADRNAICMNHFKLDHYINHQKEHQSKHFDSRTITIKTKNDDDKFDPSLPLNHNTNKNNIKH